MLFQRLSRSVLLFLSAVAFMLAATSGYGAGQPLDGKVFVAETGEKGKRADAARDIITFKDGKFHSSVCEQLGFGPGDYQTSAQGTKVAFNAETRSASQERMVWTGTISNDTIEGTVVYYRKGWFLNPNPAPIEYWLKGKAK